MCFLRVEFFAGVMQTMCQAAGAHITSCSRSGTPPNVTHNIQQLCASLLRLFQAILTTDVRRTSPEEHASAEAASQAPAGQQQQPAVTNNYPAFASQSIDNIGAAQQAQQQPKAALAEAVEQAAEPSSSHSALMAVLDFVLQACQACAPQQTAELTTLLTLFQRASNVLRENGQSIPLKAIDMYLGSDIIKQLG